MIMEIGSLFGPGLSFEYLHQLRETHRRPVPLPCPVCVRHIRWANKITCDCCGKPMLADLTRAVQSMHGVAEEL